MWGTKFKIWSQVSLYHPKNVIIIFLSLVDILTLLPWITKKRHYRNLTKVPKFYDSTKSDKKFSYIVHLYTAFELVNKEKRPLKTVDDDNVSHFHFQYFVFMNGFSSFYVSDLFPRSLRIMNKVQSFIFYLPDSEVINL